MIEYKAEDNGNILKDGHVMFYGDVAKELNRKAFLEEMYSQLIMEVSKKYPNESRHQTALRYIKQMEEPSDCAGKGE